MRAPTRRSTLHELVLVRCSSLHAARACPIYALILFPIFLVFRHFINQSTTHQHLSREVVKTLSSHCCCDPVTGLAVSSAYLVGNPVLVLKTHHSDHRCITAVSTHPEQAEVFINIPLSFYQECIHLSFVSSLLPVQGDHMFVYPSRVNCVVL